MVWSAYDTNGLGQDWREFEMTETKIEVNDRTTAFYQQEWDRQYSVEALSGNIYNEYSNLYL
ncbi:MAG: hypothetical protein LBD38_03045 [Streptococcaceae bacterium]|nr:hypothetical protein [Streptococcaceae bacterium]